MAQLPANLLRAMVTTYGHAEDDGVRTLLMCVCKALCDTLTQETVTQTLRRFHAHQFLKNLLCKSMHQLAFVFQCRNHFSDQYLPEAFIKKVFKRLGDYEAASLRILYNNCKETRRYFWTLLLRTSDPHFVSLHTVKADYLTRYSTFYPLHNSSCPRLFVTIFDACWFTGKLLSIEPIMVLRMGVIPNIRSGDYGYWNTLTSDYAMADVMKTIKKMYEEAKQNKPEVARTSSRSSK